MKWFVAAALAATVSIAGSGSASALTFGNIAGRWCGPNNSLTFTSSRITIVPYNKNPTVIEQVSGYLYSDTSIQAFFFAANTRHYYNLTEFAGRTMVATSSFNRTEYKRC